MLLWIDWSSRSNLNAEILEIADVTIQMDLRDIYLTFHPNTNKHKHEKNIPSSQYLMEPSPKLTIYSETKQVDIRKVKYHQASYQITMD